MLNIKAFPENEREAFEVSEIEELAEKSAYMQSYSDSRKLT